MQFKPQKYVIPDEPMNPFIDPAELWEYINTTKNPDISDVKKIVSRALNKNRLTLEETAVLINADQPEMIEIIKQGARDLKNIVYGDRIVLFAPLYVGNKCTNDCKYCGFRVSNKDAVRKTLDGNELVTETMALEENGQKRLILVYGEHPHYDAEYIAETVKTVYSVKRGNGEIRRVNINAAPLDIEGYKLVKEAGIGTYQVFQETYHPEIYTWYHPSGKKSDFNWRLTALDRAQEALLDDVGIGALFGLYDWRYEVLGLLRHTNHLEACYNIGPHTISFPRIKEAAAVELNPDYIVSDEEFARIVAILRLAVPYTGLILTARENADLRREVLHYGVSQIDGGTKIELGSYSASEQAIQDLNKEQFKINDSRSLNEIIDELLEDGHLPSFCTSCYRQGRTGEHFMEFSVPGFIKRFCAPNALLTLAEYIEDYAPPVTAKKGWKAIENKLSGLEEKVRKETEERIEQIKQGKRDLYF
jgi:2-iminoacetate synthase